MLQEVRERHATVSPVAAATLLRGREAWDLEREIFTGTGETEELDLLHPTPYTLQQSRFQKCSVPIWPASLPTGVAPRYFVPSRPISFSCAWGLVHGAAAEKSRLRASPGQDGNPGANLKSISHRCTRIAGAFVWEFT